MRVKRGRQAVAADAQRVLARAREAGPPKDEYGELPEVLRLGREAAAAQGHSLARWRRRPFAPQTAAATFCTMCGAVAIVDLDKSSSANGPAVQKPCPATPSGSKSSGKQPGRIQQ